MEQEQEPIKPEHNSENTSGSYIAFTKFAFFVLLCFFIPVAFYFIYCGEILKVLIFLAVLFSLVGLGLVLSFLVSEEIFLWVIGKKSEYFKILKASEAVSIALIKTTLKFLPIELNEKEKKKLKGDIPSFVRMSFMSRLNNFIIKIFIGLFAAGFGILGTIVLIQQNKKFDLQNEYVLQQNEKFDLQNKYVLQQNHLLQASIISSYNFRLSNVFDEIGKEIERQKEKPIHKGKPIDSLKFDLPDFLIGRIAVLSHAFKPYSSIVNDTITSPNSPERGQLFFALISGNLSEKTLSDVHKKVNFESANLNYSELNSENLNNFILKKAKLKRAKLNGTKLNNAQLIGADLKLASLKKAELVRADLTKANLLRAQMQKANLSKANLIGACLRGAELDTAILIEANLSNANLKKAKLNEADLTCADLEEAVLHRAELNKAIMSWVDFESADLRGAEFNGANLSWANVNGASLQNADLTGADLTGVDLSKAKTLKGVKGLSKVLRDSLKLHYPILFKTQ